jgi:DNA modification methylase
MMKERYTLHHGDSLVVLASMPENSVDSIVCDPPYELGFMGKAWDKSGIANNVDLWREALRVLKPGGHLLAFSGSRTYHRMACAIEDAGFELRDQIMWVYATGFPKSRNIGEGRGTALKPAHEPICVARKALDGTVAANVEKHGPGALYIDACRVGDEVRIERIGSLEACSGNAFGAAGTAEARRGAERVEREYVGRWPANVIHDGSPEVLALFPNAPGARAPVTGNEPSSKTNNVYGRFDGRPATEPRVDQDTSAARFFKQIETSDEEWLIQNLRLFPALTAASSLSLSNVLDAIAQSDAAISLRHAGMQLSAAKAPSIAVTPSESRKLAEAVTTAIQNIAPKFLREWQQKNLSPTNSPVSVVATREPTGITTITASHWSSDGSAEPVTFSITPTSSEVGAKGCEPSTGNRFIYCPKASPADRHEGLQHPGPKFKQGTTLRKVQVAEAAGELGGNNHPTVKPTELMAYLCRLVTPPGGTVLDPFCGSGSTGKAAMREGFNFIGIELDAGYVAIADARIKFELLKQEPAPEPEAPPADMRQLDLLSHLSGF